MANEHRCPGGCGRTIPIYLLACSTHWNLVPKALRTEVYRTQRARRARPHDPSTVGAHMTAMARAIRHMAPEPAHV